MYVPPITDDLLDYLETIYPLKAPSITDSDRAIWIAVGQQEVIDKLTHEHELQKQNVLKEQ